MIKKSDLVAIFTTYEPSQGLLENLYALLDQIQEVIIIDDGSQSINSIEVLKRCANVPNVTLYYNHNNSGIAYSLNRGIQKATDKGYEWALTMDQDSQVSPDFVDAIVQSLNQSPNRGKIALVTPRIFDARQPDKVSKLLINNGKPWFSMVRMSPNDRDDVLIAITSGCLTNIPKVQKVGGFPNSFFIDYVDTRVSLTLIQAGYHILYSGKAVLSHNLGVPESINLGVKKVRALNHNPFRRYYVARNTVYMYLEFWRLFPNWILYDIYIGIYTCFTIIFFEDAKLKKLRYSIKGFYHGLLGVKGKLN